MGLPPEDRPTNAGPGTFVDDPPVPVDPSPLAQGGTHRRYNSGEAGTMSGLPTSQERTDQTLAERPRGAGRRPSGQSREQRLCGKCGRHLTGQFV